ncbi:MAG TPA: ComEC/Rec2 family competence protein [Gaiellaceae bacterium]|nr:ComEC/Rec2 family competence protein [Gaiellaceae bacterium]
MGLALGNVSRIHVVGIAGSVVAAGALVFAPTPQVRLAVVAVVLCLLGWWWSSMRLDTLDRSPMLAQVGSAGHAIVVITAPPTHGQFNLRAQGRIRRFNDRAIDEPVELELALGRSPPQGAIIDALAVVTLPRGPEHGFDERTWLRRHGIHVVLKVDEWRPIGHRGGIGGVADGLRLRLGHAIAPGLGGERRTVLEGIVLGDDNALPDSLKHDFRASGLYHLLAVSGENVVLVAGCVLLLAWLVGIQRWIGELGALAAIGAYVLAVGPQPSVIRAGVAGSLASLAWLTGRLRDAWYVLLVAAIVLLGWNPYLVYDPGFELSFAAVLAIFTLAPRISRRLEGYPIPARLRMVIAVSTACGVVTAPILWLQFGALPLLSVPANALAEPAMPLLLGLAFATAGLDAVSPSAAAMLAWLNGWLATYIAFCAHAVGSVPFAYIHSLRALAGVGGTLLFAAYAWRRWRMS